MGRSGSEVLGGREIPFLLFRGVFVMVGRFRLVDIWEMGGRIERKREGKHEQAG